MFIGGKENAKGKQNRKRFRKKFSSGLLSRTFKKVLLDNIF